MGTLDSLGTVWRSVRYGLPLARLRPESPRTIADVVEEQAAARPAHPFLLFEDRRVSYAAFDAAANRVARWALAQGLGHGDRVALLMHNRPEFLETWAGLAKVGATSALINTNLVGRALEHAIATADVKHVIVGSECLEALASVDGAAPWQVWVFADKGHEGAKAPQGARDLSADLATRPSANPAP